MNVITLSLHYFTTMVARKQEQINFTVSREERELLEAIAKKLGRSLSNLVKEASLRGVPAVVEDFEKVRKAAGKNDISN